MTNIQFDGDQEFSRPIEKFQPSVFVRFVLSTGLAKTEKVANYLLFGISIVGIIFTFFVLFSSGNKSPVQTFKEGQNVIGTVGAMTP